MVNRSAPGGIQVHTFKAGILRRNPLAVQAPHQRPT